MIVLRAQLAGKKVLVVESEFLLPAALYRAIELLGAEVLGPVGFPDDVLLILAGNRPDHAVVDGRIDPDDRDAILRVLRRMRIPFAEASEYIDGMNGQNVFLPLSDAQSEPTYAERALFA